MSLLRTLSRFWVRSPVVENRDTRGNAFEIAVPVVAILPSLKAFFINVYVIRKDRPFEFPVRTQILAVFRKNFKTAGIASLIINYFEFFWLNIFWKT